MQSSNDSRDDVNLKHVKARGKQPKVSAMGPKKTPASPPIPNYNMPGVPTSNFNIYIVHSGCESKFGSIADQVDQTRWRFQGVSPHVTRAEDMCGRRTIHTCMASGFQY